MFEGRKLIIATKHKKEIVIAKHLNEKLGVNCQVSEDFDTDVFGTFTGEKERALSPLDTVRKKCLMAMEKFGYDLGVASEGSFGPHPALFFIPADEEFMVFIDKKNNLEINVKKLSSDTNFSGRSIKNEEELEKYIKAIQFPGHGIILRKSRDSNENIIKDIDSIEQLKKHFKSMVDLLGEVYVETDMRAMNNPTRMKVIEETTLKLIEAIKSICPNCSTPGFVPINHIAGLPCSLCGLPTKSIKIKVLGCKKCGYEMEKIFPNNKKEEDPQYCDYCNP
ncbi:MAG: DUF6671 family protein [Chitinophagia bacterium]